MSSPFAYTVSIRRKVDIQRKSVKPLSRERILKAAIALADKDGLEAVSMRKVGQALGVEAMSLYNHVRNKDELLSGMVDLVAGEFERASAAESWKDSLRNTALSVHETLLRHRWVAGLWWRSGGGEERMQYGDALLRTFREAGFSSDLTYHAYHAFEGYVVGYTLQIVNLDMDEERIAEMAEWFLRSFPSERYPDLAEHVKQHLEPHDGDGAFELGLDLILDGFERLK